MIAGYRNRSLKSSTRGLIGRVHIGWMTPWKCCAMRNGSGCQGRGLWRGGCGAAAVVRKRRKRKTRRSWSVEEKIRTESLPGRRSRRWPSDTASRATDCRRGARTGTGGAVLGAGTPDLPPWMAAHSAVIEGRGVTVPSPTRAGSRRSPWRWREALVHAEWRPGLWARAMTDWPRWCWDLTRIRGLPMSFAPSGLTGSLWWDGGSVLATSGCRVGLRGGGSQRGDQVTRSSRRCSRGWTAGRGVRGYGARAPQRKPLPRVIQP